MHFIGDFETNNQREYMMTINDNLRVIKKLDFEAVDFIFEALHNAFHPNGLEEGSPDPNFLALWTLSLSCCGWSEDEYWKEQDDRSADSNESEIESKSISPENKLN